MTKTYLSLVLLTLVSACSVWASNGEYEFVDTGCTQDLECAAAAFATPACNVGRCELMCDAGRADCDDEYENGCEADLGSIASCGMCGVSCEASGGNMAVCEAGACIVECNAAEFLNCDMSDANGCETDGTTTANCGGCGVMCNDGEFCSDDGASYSCAVTCDMPRTVCGDACVDTDVVRLHCGSCGNVCGNENTSEDSTCLGGACVLNCADGFDDCDGDPNNGCETSLDTAGTCGSCDVACSTNNANPLCDVSGGDPVCTIVDCTAGYENCNGDATDGCEIDTDVDLVNCGMCGIVCGDQNTSAASECTGGMCVLTCAADFEDCDGDPSNGCERSTVTLDSCESCAVGRLDCNGDIPTDGCEVDSDNDMNNCGGCGAVCGSQNTSASQCNAGMCELTCAAGYADADGDAANGCEALGDVVDVAGAEHHSCIIRSGGHVYCTGRDTYGAIGPSTPSEVLTPRRIVFADDTPLVASSLSAGENHTCAIDTTGHLYCWGRNTDLRLGQMPASAHSEYPVPVQADVAETMAFAARTFVVLSTNQRHSCALDDLGGVWCWGNGWQGALGHGAGGMDDDALARLVPLPLPAESVATGFKNSGAVLSDGRVYGWGTNEFGTLGMDPAVTPMVLTPVELFVGTPVRALAMGFRFSCFIELNDTVNCVGYNADLRTGSAGPTSHVPRPVSVSGIPQTLFAGIAHACAMTSVGISCWGRNDEGEVGGGMFSGPGGELPTDVVFPPGITPTFLSNDGSYNSCAIAGGSAFCWGRNAVENLSVADDDWTTIGRPEGPDESPLPLISVTAGSRQGCGATTDSLYCWGSALLTMWSNSGDIAFHHEPVEIALPSGVASVVSVSAGEDHTCFVGDNGVAYCSGDNSQGALGIPGGRRNSPTAIPLPSGIEEVAASLNSTCARTGSSVYCFGESALDPMSAGRDLDRVTGGSDVSTPVPDVTDATQLAAGRTFYCALQMGGQVRCWGWDNAGQRGDGSDDDGIVNLPMAAMSVAAASAHACAVLVDGRVMCWGSANFGRVGNGATSGGFVDPAFVIDSTGTPITGAVDVGASEVTSCAVLATGSVMCWGGSRFGELGGEVDSAHAISRPGITDALSVSGGAGSGSDVFGGASHMCFMRSGTDGEGPAGCIGNRNHGRTGDQTSFPRVSAPRSYRGPPAP